MTINPHIEIETSLEPNMMNIMGSPVHLFKSVMNLVANAVESMPDGGTISINIEEIYR